MLRRGVRLRERGAVQDYTSERLARLSMSERLDLTKLTVPRIPPGGYIPSAPHMGPQHLFLCLDDILEVFYGGAVGGGKSFALLAAALQYVDVPGYAALILRRTWPDLSQPGALMDRAKQWLRNTDAIPREGGRGWDFPSGATLRFAYADRFEDVERQFTGPEFQFIGIDELTRGWEQRSYEFLFSRLRKSVDADYGGSSWDGSTLRDVPLRMRSGSNPGGSGAPWVKKMFIDPKTRDPATVFIPAKLKDNPSLDYDEYVRSLDKLAPVERERMLEGDWDVVEEGEYFQREWFRLIGPEAVPVGCDWCRYWDLAARSPGRQGPPDGDWVAGALVGLSPAGQWYIVDVRRTRGTPLEVERFVESTLEWDQDIVGGYVPTYVASKRIDRVEQEPGSSGVITVDHYRREIFVGRSFDGHKPVTSKEVRAQPVSSAAEAGNVHVVSLFDPRPFFEQAELFPTPKVHDDLVDGVSGAFACLTLLRTKGRKKKAKASSVAHRRGATFIPR